jgi:transcriptional regulator with XRE-family HTH domain
MRPMLYVRKHVLGINQAEMAEIAKVSQGTVSKWEADEGPEPSRDALARIRSEIHRRRLDWQDRWFFEAPKVRAS